jgi:F0F1-type ATP synthase membrane subunit b/b'
VDAEIERVRREMREASEAEHRRVMQEAGARRQRLEREAQVLIEQELKAVRQELTLETSRAALRSAREMLVSATSGDDQRRLTDEFLVQLASRRNLSGADGGSAS